MSDSALRLQHVATLVLANGYKRIFASLTEVLIRETMFLGVINFDSRRTIAEKRQHFILKNVVDNTVLNWFYLA